MIIQLTQLGDQMAKNKEMNLQSDWVREFCQYSKPNDTKEISRSFRSRITHAGLIFYLHYCWAHEFGCVLRPDMIWYTIVSEIAKQVLDNPEEYRHLFTDSQEKKTIVTQVDDVSSLDINVLTQQIKTIISDKNFFETICETRFESEAENANYAVRMAFACMSTPFFDYITTSCGIKCVDLQGSHDDWTRLSNAILALSKFKPKSEWMEDSYNNYVSNCFKIVKNIINYGFAPIKMADDWYLGSSKEEFWNNIFHYGMNTRCGSGHDVMIVDGWIKGLYFNNNPKTPGTSDIYKFNTHINYVPYVNAETGKKFVQGCGLVYSINNNGILDPQYGFVKHQVLNDELFKKLAKQDDKRHGEIMDSLPDFIGKSNPNPDPDPFIDELNQGPKFEPESVHQNNRQYMNPGGVKHDRFLHRQFTNFTNTPFGNMEGKEKIKEKDDYKEFIKQFPQYAL